MYQLPYLAHYVQRELGTVFGTWNGTDSEANSWFYLRGGGCTLVVTRPYNIEYCGLKANLASESANRPLQSACGSLLCRQDPDH